MMDIQPFLNKHQDQLINELRDFIATPLPDEVRCVEVMIFRETMPRVPFRVFFLNRFKTPAKTIESFVPLSDLEVLVDSEEYISCDEATCECLALETESEQDLCMEKEDKKYDLEVKMLCGWFGQCWKAAGGEGYQYNAFVVEEDCKFNPYDLKTGAYIKHLHEYTKVFNG